MANVSGPTTNITFRDASGNVQVVSEDTPLPIGMAASGLDTYFESVAGYNAAVAQRLTHDDSGALLWVDEA